MPNEGTLELQRECIVSHFELSLDKVRGAAERFAHLL
jgi:hypothetical protein